MRNIGIFERGAGGFVAGKRVQQHIAGGAVLQLVDELSLSLIICDEGSMKHPSTIWRSMAKSEIRSDASDEIRANIAEVSGVPLS